VARVVKVGKVKRGLSDPDPRGSGRVGKVAPPYKGATFLTLTRRGVELSSEPNPADVRTVEGGVVRR
jgi:hypothetical protein